ncbi:MAG: ABC-2 family transporter protein [Lachnospiraceae bacterium]|nr:ABC-2 family transporter protein [Lachnospiraceae bacterium]
MKRNVKLYFLYISAILRGMMQYKLSLVLMMIGRFVVAFNGFLGIYFLFSGFTQIKGYSYAEVLLCFSIMQMSFSIAECIGAGFNVFSGMVKRGEFDRILLRPCSPILQILGTRFEIGKLGPMVTALIMLGIGIKNSSISWNAANILTLIFMIAGGVILFLGLFLLGATVCFFSIEDTTLIHILTYGAKDHGKYPLDIYGKGIMRFCTFVIPYTLIQYYPLQFLLGRTDAWWFAVCPVGTLVFAGVSYAVWRIGMRRYVGCGG